MREKKSLDAIIGSFDPTETTEVGNLKGGTVTTWLSPEYKASYDRLQKQSKRRFAKIVRELIQTAIDRAEAKAS